MDERLLELLKKQIDKIENLKNTKSWGPEYQIWVSTTTKIVKPLFGDEYFKMFEKSLQRSVFSMNPSQNQRYYVEDLNEVKTLLEGLIEEKSREDITDLASTPQIDLPGYQLHEKIREVAFERFSNGQYTDAVEAAFKLVIKRVKDYIKEKTGEELDGDPAMNRAFGFERQDPIVKFNDLNTREEKDEQKGIMFLFKGIVGIRNRKVHENVLLDDPKRAFEYLALASLLMRFLDSYAK